MRHVESFETYLNDHTQKMVYDLNDVKFGNPTKPLMDKENAHNDLEKWFFSSGLEKEFIQAAPKNNSQQTKTDLETIIGMMQNVTPEDIAFAQSAEDDHLKLIADFVRSKGFEATEEECLSITNQTDPLLFHLKREVNRPRPHQLAFYYKMDLYPLIHTNANSASYPSGHALDAYMVTNHFAEKYPQIAGELRSLGARIANSRVYTGIHYPSDSEASAKLAEHLKSSKLI